MIDEYQCTNEDLTINHKETPALSNHPTNGESFGECLTNRGFNLMLLYVDLTLIYAEYQIDI